MWDTLLGHLKTKPNNTLEIGALYGGGSVYILEEFCKHPESTHTILDINENDFIVNNLIPYGKKVKYILGESSDGFRTLKGKDVFDLIYIDGNHMSNYVLEDVVNSFYCLKENGYIIFDDYGGGWEQEKYLQVRTAVDSFNHSYYKYIEILHVGYQVIMKKIKYINENDLKENYYKV